MTSDESSHSKTDDAFAGITADVINATIAAAFEQWTKADWYRNYSRATRHNIKCTFYKAVDEMLALITVRGNIDQTFAPVLKQIAGELQEEEKAIVAETMELARIHGATFN